MQENFRTINNQYIRKIELITCVAGHGTFKSAELLHRECTSAVPSSNNKAINPFPDTFTSDTLADMLYVESVVRGIDQFTAIRCCSAKSPTVTT